MGNEYNSNVTRRKALGNEYNSNVTRRKAMSIILGQ